MRVLIAFDKFKDALTAREACDIAARALRERHPDWQLDLCPLSDGGDGFEDVLGHTADGHRVPLQVTGPRGGLVEAGFTLVASERIPKIARALLPADCMAGADSQLAIIEMATASGLALLPPHQRDVWRATSHGTGQLIRAAAEHGATVILLGVGGSATHDLGLGALAALGLDFCDAHGAKIRPPLPTHWEDIAQIAGQLPASLPPLFIATDVLNPLLGPHGAATVYAPQKGLRREEFPALEAASERIAHLLCEHFHQPLSTTDIPGAGAAGGIAFGLVCAARAQLLPGAALVAAWLDLDTRYAAADLIVTGEGRFDSSSLSGKGPGALATRAVAAKKPVHVFAGQVAIEPQDRLFTHEITPVDLPLDRALRDAAAFLDAAVRRAL